MDPALHTWSIFDLRAELEKLNSRLEEPLPDKERFQLQTQAGQIRSELQIRRIPHPY